MNGNEKQTRDTRQRRLVYDNVMSRCDHPNADSIYWDIHSLDDKISKGTVYRNLNLLADQDEILRVRVPGADRFDSRLDNHCHIICMSCGRVVDAPIPYTTSYDNDVAANTGFQVTRHRTVFEGICPDCQN